MSRSQGALAPCLRSQYLFEGRGRWQVEASGKQPSFGDWESDVGCVCYWVKTPREEQHVFLDVVFDLLIQQEAFERVQQNQVTWTCLEGFRERR